MFSLIFAAGKSFKTKLSITKSMAHCQVKPELVLPDHLQNSEGSAQSSEFYSRFPWSDDVKFNATLLLQPRNSDRQVHSILSLCGPFVAP